MLCRSPIILRSPLFADVRSAAIIAMLRRAATRSKRKIVFDCRDDRDETRRQICGRYLGFCDCLRHDSMRSI